MVEISDIKKAYRFKTRPEWCPSGVPGMDGVEFLIAPNMRALTKKYGELTRPFTRRGKTVIPADRANEINAKTIVGTIVLDWRGITEKGKSLPYSEDRAVDLFMATPAQVDDITEIAIEMSRTQETEDAEADDNAKK